MRRLKKGRGIRVVGRLKQYISKYSNSEKVFIQAEHIEVQPRRVTEKQEIPTMEKLQGVPVASANMHELDIEDEDEARRMQEEQPQAPQGDSDAERIAEESAERVEDTIPVDEENQIQGEQKEDNDDPF